jgi:hypothetical protein
MKNPALQERGLPKDPRMHYLRMHYLLARLEALSGLTLVLFAATAVTIWEARLQFPFFHFSDGSGQALQYQLAVTCTVRLHPLHFSTISWQIPPL